jgi:GntR family transcriptional regulator/MocR family aminotransferase
LEPDIWNMSQLLLYLDPESSLSLQAQIRAALVEAILGGQIPPDSRLPSTRQLAKQLEVSRNTVIAAVQDLIAEGFLISRERSGTYVNKDVLKRDVTSSSASIQNSLDWGTRLATSVPYLESVPHNWRQFPYVFISRQVDEKLFPINEWRECDRIAHGVREIKNWIADPGMMDDTLLVEEIRTKLLPRRGITARPEEILITNDSQNALALIAQLLIASETRIGVESPGNSAAHSLFTSLGADVLPLEIDERGVRIVDELSGCQLLYTTPSHQFPTTVTMSMDRRVDLLEAAMRDDFVVIEDDSDPESNFLQPNSPALKGIDTQDRVLYVSSLSNLLAPGLRIGYMVASEEFIEQARRLRQLTSLAPSGYVQRTAGLFLSLGHFDALVRKLDQTRERRWLELRQAINYCFPQPDFMIEQSQGGTACWIEGPEGLDVFELVDRAQHRGILLDRPQSYLLAGYPKNGFRLSINCIDLDQIRPGLTELSKLIKEMLSGFRETLNSATGERLSSSEIESVFPGSALLGTTAYGDAYTVQIHEGGVIDIVYDNAAGDTDSGRWWVENNQWWRQFSKSTYGEPRGFYVVLQENMIKWFDDDGDLVDTEVFIRGFHPETAKSR